MGYNFPASPSNGQVYGRWKWSAEKQVWRENAVPFVSAIYEQATAPTNPRQGDLWVNTNTGTTYVFYDDGTSRQWVERQVSDQAIPAKDGVTLLTSESTNVSSLLAREYAWGGKSGPSSWSSAYINIWNFGKHSGTGIDATTYTDGVMITESGVYEVRTGQRASGTGNDYVGIGVAGNRATLEGRLEGMWSHDHSSNTSTWTQSYYIGPLYAGEKITSGSPGSGAALVYGTDNAYGYLSVRRLK
jgi:hypothetical protein